ncbi:MAG TPA: hypothetical protein PLU30_22135 [Verrucomicrobiae bacterium]|nr:hypothetical protein [Verrucomicrobiae bacterium]
MRKSISRMTSILVATLLLAGGSPAAEPSGHATRQKALNVLFIGNSFTASHQLAQLVKAMAEAGDPSLSFNVTTVLYGGRRLVDHWRLGTQNFVRVADLTPGEEQATVKSLEEMIAKDPNDKYAIAALARHRDLSKNLEGARKKWDLVVLQSYRDDAEGEKSLYAQYAPKFAELIKAQGGKVVLYETTPTTQNAKPLTAPPDPAPVTAKAKAIAALAKRIDAIVVPMSIVALRCQTVRPDFTLRYVSDAHLNQTMGYLTACAFYAALFHRSPEGLPIDTVNDNRPKVGGQPAKDPDGGPLKRTFSAQDRTDLQRIAWDGLKEFQQIAGGQ